MLDGAEIVPVEHRPDVSALAFISIILQQTEDRCRCLVADSESHDSANEKRVIGHDMQLTRQVGVVLLVFQYVISFTLIDQFRLLKNEWSNGIEIRQMFQQAFLLTHG